jgi:hypothetical protein
MSAARWRYSQPRGDPRSRLANLGLRCRPKTRPKMSPKLGRKCRRNSAEKVAETRCLCCRLGTSYRLPMLPRCRSYLSPIAVLLLLLRSPIMTSSLSTIWSHLSPIELFFFRLMPTAPCYLTRFLIATRVKRTSSKDSRGFIRHLKFGASKTEE